MYMHMHADWICTVNYMYAHICTCTFEVLHIHVGATSSQGMVDSPSIIIVHVHVCALNL